MARNFVSASNQYLSVASVPVSAYPLTMACWFYSTSATANQTLVTIGTVGSANHYFSLYLDGTATGDPVAFNTRTTSAGEVLTTSGYATDTWQHACGVGISNTSRAVFVNGGSKGTATSNRTPSGVDSVYIGRRHTAAGGQNYMVGRIAEIAIWNVALSDVEVALLANRISPLMIKPKSLVAYWPLMGIGSPEPDYSSGVRNLTLNGDTPSTQADHAPVMQFIPNRQGWRGAFTAVAAPAAVVALERQRLRMLRGLGR